MCRNMPCWTKIYAIFCDRDRARFPKNAKHRNIYKWCNGALSIFFAKRARWRSRCLVCSSWWSFFLSQFLESDTNLTSNCFFLGRKYNWISNFFAVLVSFNFSVEGRTFSCFSVRIIGSNCIYLNIRTICWHKIFVNETSFFPDRRVLIMIQSGNPRTVQGCTKPSTKGCFQVFERENISKYFIDMSTPSGSDLWDDPSKSLIEVRAKRTGFPGEVFWISAWQYSELLFRTFLKSFWWPPPAVVG